VLNWDNFFVAEVGASASLAGLIFVGVSININRIIALPRLPGRAIQALVVLLMVFVVALLYLVPGQSIAQLGAEIIGVGVTGWVGNTTIDFRNYKRTPKEFKQSYVVATAGLDQVSLLFYIFSGIATVLFGGNGLYLLVPATILSFLKSIIDAWVLLVEINR
jgi:hypothetical protein